jgi:hypothetical protein
MPPRRVLGLAWPLLCLAACSTESMEAPHAAGPNDAGSDVASADGAAADAAFAVVHGHVIFDKLNNQALIPAQNRVIGIVGSDSSTTTDDDGAYTLDAPVDADVVLRAELPGEISVQRLIHVPANGVEVELHVIDIDAFVGATEQLPTTPNAFETGTAAVRFSGSTTGGYGATLSAANGGSFLFDTTENGFAVAAQETTAGGDSLYYYAVTPGTTSVSATTPNGASACNDAFAPNATEYPVTVGTVTEVVLACP